MEDSSLIIAPLTEAEARQVVRWQYPPPYNLYVTQPEHRDAEVEALLDPDNQCYALREQSGAFIGFVSLGADARVEGGDYDAPAVDLGIGIRPELTGQGQGKRYLRALVGFARCRQSEPQPLRVTVAAFNQRAQRLVCDAGFAEAGRFRRERDDTEFVIYLLDPA